MSIYKIFNDDECYIGKTKIKYVSKRINKHTYLFKHNAKYQCSSKKIFEKGEWNWCILEKDIPHDKLAEREQYYINNTPECINQQKVLLNEDEKKIRSRELQKKYYEKNKGTEKDHNNTHKEYKSIWYYKKKYGDDWEQYKYKKN